MAHEKLRPEYFFDVEKIEQLKQLAPECFEDGKINFETLRQNLGDWTQDGEDPELEHFGLFWPGKRDARKAATIAPEGTLEPLFGEGLKADGSSDSDGRNDSKNIFIEGENLEVLKLLQKSYASKVKMIYIDPPYNTGNDFVYDDDFTEPLQEYLRRTGQVDEEGKALTTNKKSDGRFHSKWLSMMYPRLRLARNLLTDHGAIFVSIDDNEVHNLRAILNEIFGEENFIAQLVWEKKKKGAFLAGDITNMKEYILVYCKEKLKFEGLIGEIAKETETYPVIKTTNNRGQRNIPKGIHSKYSERDHVAPKGTRISAGNMELILLSDMIIKDGILMEDVLVDSNWIYSQELLNEFASKKQLYITQDLYFRRIVDEPREKKLKDILSRVGENGVSGDQYKKSDNLYADGWGTNEDGNNELHELLGGQNIFDFPKPSKLLAKLIASVKGDNFFVLDFFSGSASIAHAVMAVNDGDNGERKFICVQLPKAIDSTEVASNYGYKKITDISKKRIINAFKKYKLKDSGFKCFNLTKSNYKRWTNYNGGSIAEMEAELALFSDNPLREDYTKPGLLTEITLLEGMTLCSTIEGQEKIKSNTIKKIKSEYCKHSLLVCLDEKIESGTIQGMSMDDNEIFICLDNAISVEDKLRLSDKGLIKTI